MRTSGPWDQARSERHLQQSVVPLRLGCADESGWPVVVSLWYLFENGALWCATPARSRVAEWLAREPRRAFEVAPNEPPYFGVRGQGRAELLPDDAARVLRRLALRYLGGDSSEFARWLLARRVPEVAIRVVPVRIASWDFSERMRNA
jgi:nitroimidazol reductase NimA-like FMN-containing flavoprotein (pyridoxamine 5'-phosphate oxidase superfamily)